MCDIDSYVKKRILFEARKMYDYKSLLELAKKDDNIKSILLKHKSMAERAASFKYYDCLRVFLDSAKTIIDIGCGLNPILTNMRFCDFFNYYCVDKDEKILEILNLLNKRFCNRNIQIIHSDLYEIPNEISNVYCDFAFVQKIIPTLEYDSNEKVLANIANLNSSYFLVTGSRFSLSRNAKIEKEERLCLESFIEKYNFVKVSSFEKQNEFGWVIKKYV